MNEDIHEQKIIPVNQMIIELLSGIVLYGFLSYIIYRITFGFLIQIFELKSNILLQIIILFFLEGILAWITLKLANKRALQKGTIYQYQVKKVITYLAFVLGVFVLIEVVGRISIVGPTVDKALKNDLRLRYQEQLVLMTNDQEKVEKYRKEKQQMIKKLKNKSYYYVFIKEIGVIIIYGAVIFLEKKYVACHAQ